MADGDVAVRPHGRHPDWLVDDRGRTWRRERVFGCEHHPFGPPAGDECGDEHVACAALVRGLWDELGSATAISTVTGCTIEQISAAHQELGLCCAGHRWRNTGRLLEVGPFEQFIYDAMPARVEQHRSVLLEELLRDQPFDEQAGKQVRIPLIIERGTPLPRSTAADAEHHYRLDRPGAPPTIE